MVSRQKERYMRVGGSSSESWIIAKRKEITILRKREIEIERRKNKDLIKAVE